MSEAENTPSNDVTMLTETQSLAQETPIQEQQFPETDISNDQSLMAKMQMMQNEKIELNEENLAAHEGQTVGVTPRDTGREEVDRTLNATRNSNSLDGIDIDTYPETMDELEREEQPGTLQTYQTEPDKQKSDDELEREENEGGAGRDPENGELQPITEQDSDALDRSALIVAEHEKMAKSEAKQNQILNSMTKKSPAPYKNESLGQSQMIQKVAEHDYKYQQDGSADSGIRQQQPLNRVGAGGKKPSILAQGQVVRSSNPMPYEEELSADPKVARIQKSSSRLYKHAQLIEAKRQNRKRELDEKETQEIQKARKEQQDRLAKTKKKFQLQSKPIYERTENLIETKEKKIQEKQNTLALNKHLAKVKAEHRAQVDEVHIRDGIEAATRFESKIAASPEELDAVLLQRAHQSLKDESERKRNEVAKRFEQLKKAQQDRLEEERNNGGKLAFGSKADVVVTKTDRQLEVQARREIEEEWSDARLAEKIARKEKPENVVARQEARQARHRLEWNKKQLELKKQQEQELKQQATFKPQTNANSTLMTMQKAQKAQMIASGQPSSVGQVYSTGLTLDEKGAPDAHNPYTVVERLYERLEEKKIKQANHDELLFKQKHTFAPTVYSERPPENPYLATQASERVALPAKVDPQPVPVLTSTQLLNVISDRPSNAYDTNPSSNKYHRPNAPSLGFAMSEDGKPLGAEVELSPQNSLTNKMEEFNGQGVPRMAPIDPVSDAQKAGVENGAGMNLPVINESGEDRSIDGSSKVLKQN